MFLMAIPFFQGFWTQSSQNVHTFTDQQDHFFTNSEV